MKYKEEEEENKYLLNIGQDLWYAEWVSTYVILGVPGQLYKMKEANDGWPDGRDTHESSCRFVSGRALELIRLF